MKAGNQRLNVAVSRNIRLTLQYDGTDFAGYELQPGKRTIRGELEKALFTLCKRKLRVSAVSRTDAGVHAVGAVVYFAANNRIPISKLPAALNSVLPEDIKVKRAEEVEGLKGGKAKEYQYLIYNGEVMPPHLRRIAWHVKPKLNLAVMRKAAKFLIGKHDFSSFCAAGGDDKDYFRIIHSLGIRHLALGIWPGCQSPVISCKFVGKGFLYKMVRNLVGTLVDVGLGRTRPIDVKAILEAKDRRRAGRTAPARGLCLTKIRWGV